MSGWVADSPLGQGRVYGNKATGLRTAAEIAKLRLQADGAALLAAESGWRMLQQPSCACLTGRLYLALRSFIYIDRAPPCKDKIWDNCSVLRGGLQQ